MNAPDQTTQSQPDPQTDVQSVGEESTTGTGTIAQDATVQRVARAALLVMVFYLLSRVTGLVREVIVGAQFGTSAGYDAYLAAFRVPDTLFQLIAGGALGSAFVPVFSQFWVKGEKAGAWLLFSRVLNLVTVVLIGAAGVAAMFALPLVERVIAPGFSAEQQQLTANLMRLMLFSTVLFGISGLVMGALNAMQHFLWPAVAPTVYNLAIIAGAWLLGESLGVYGVAIGVVAGSLGHLLVQLPDLFHAGARYSRSWAPRDPSVSEVARLMAPRVLGLLFVQMHFLVNTILASGLVTGSLSSLNYAWLLMLLPLGIFAQSVATAAFPTFAAQVAAGQSDEMRHTFGQALRTVLFVELPAATGLFLFGAALVGVLLERGAFTEESTLMVAYALQFYAVGLAAHGALEIVVRAFYALHDTWTPVAAGIAAMVLNIVLSLLLIGPLNFGGLALASSLAVIVETLLLLLLLRRRMGGIEGRALLVTLARSALACIGMGLLLRLIVNWLPTLSISLGEWLAVLLGILAAAFVYIAISWLLRSPELQLATSPILRRLRR